MEQVKDLSVFSVIIEPCEEGGFFASCPALQGCHAEGESYAQALEAIEDVIRQHIALRLEKGEALSSFSNLKSVTTTVSLPVALN